MNELNIISTLRFRHSPYHPKSSRKFAVPCAQTHADLSAGATLRDVLGDVPRHDASVSPSAENFLALPTLAGTAARCFRCQRKFGSYKALLKHQAPMRCKCLFGKIRDFCCRCFWGGFCFFMFCLILFVVFVCWFLSCWEDIMGSVTFL